MLDRMVTEIEELVEEMSKVEELMKHNIYMRSIANKAVDSLELGDYVTHLHTEFEVLSSRHGEVDNILRELCMSMYMSEE